MHFSCHSEMPSFSHVTMMLLLPWILEITSQMTSRPQWKCKCIHYNLGWKCIKWFLNDWYNDSQFIDILLLDGFMCWYMAIYSVTLNRGHRDVSGMINDMMSHWLMSRQLFATCTNVPARVWARVCACLHASFQTNEYDKWHAVFTNYRINQNNK